MVELYHCKKDELAKRVKHFWQYEDLNLDFRKLLNELKAVADLCPDCYSEQFHLEILEIETSLRDDCLIE